MRPTGNHVNRFNFFSTDLELHRLAGIDIPLPDQTVAVNYDEQLPLGIVPMLSFCNARSGNIYADLSAIGCMQLFGKTAAVINIHLHRILELLFRKIGQIQ